MKIDAIFVVCALAMLTLPLHAAQLYRWVDEKGNVEWRDTPPPASAKKVEQRNIGASTIPTSELPYSLQLAVKNFPVTLWATDCGELCNKGRTHLKRRGVPYTERDPRADLEGFKKITGSSGEVPFLMVGNTRLKGYLEAEWDSALDVAGYPRTAIAAVKPKVVAAKPAAAAPSASIVKLYTSSDCGPPCAQAKELLGSRGVPFQEIVADASPAIDELRKLSGDIFVPTLIAGRLVVRSFVAADYHNALDQAGFGKAEAQPKP